MLDNSNGYIQAIKQITQIIDSGVSRTKTLTHIARTTAKTLKAAGCTIMLLSRHRKHLSIIAAYGLSDQYLRKGALNVHKSLPEIMEGKITIISDITQDNRAQYPEAAQIENINSIIGAPVFNNNEIIGEIRVYSQQCRQFSLLERDFLLAVSHITSLVLEKPEMKAIETLPDGQKLIESASLHYKSVGPTNFSHESEEEFAKLLDFYKIEWLYEPRSFPLLWKGKQVTEMFTPDFYLPELDLYIEITTLKQSLITEKNRKLRQVKELYPNINIKLLNKNDYFKLLAKYGYGPLGSNKVEGVSHVLLTRSQIQRRTRSLAKLISSDYAGKHLILIGVLKGVICFLSDLMREITLPLSVELMGISYFGIDPDKSVKITKDIDISIADQHVLMVEDIVDTGMTLNFILGHLNSFNPASLRVCTLLDKKARRLINVPLEYIGFEVPDEFVIGYGLDYQGKYRNLPFIATLNPGMSGTQK